VDLARFEVEIPPGWTCRHAWLRVEGPVPTIDPSRTSWELRGLAGNREVDPLGESDAERAPWLVLTFEPPDRLTLENTAVIDTWSSLGLWYSDLTRGRDAVTPAIDKASRAVRAASSGDWVERVRKGAKYVRDQVRYVDKELGIGGYLPRPAAQVLQEKFGDCKDKGTLLRAFLAAEGIESHPILVHATQERTVSDEVPALQSFNHFVVGIPFPADFGGKVPPDLLPATVILDGHARVLVVDPTNDVASIGSLPGNLAGKRVLLVDGEESRLVTLPDGDATAHRIERTFLLTIEGDGAVAMREESTMFGDPAGVARASFRRSPQDFRREAGRRVAHRWPEAVVDEHAVQAETQTGDFVETISWRVPSLPSVVSFFPSLASDFPRAPLRDRSTAVVYPWCMTLHFESHVRHVPHDAALPAGREVEGPGWRVSTRFTRDADTASGVLVISLARRRFQPDEFDDLGKLWNAVREAAQAAVALRLD